MDIDKINEAYSLTAYLRLLNNTIRQLEGNQDSHVGINEFSVDSILGQNEAALFCSEVKKLFISACEKERKEVLKKIQAI